MEILNRNNSAILRKNTTSPPTHKKQQQLFSDLQKNFLIQFYDNTEHYPTPEEYAVFAVRFNISKCRVKTWFQNRRARLHKRRNRVPPLKTRSETWNQAVILTLEPPVAVVNASSGFSTNIWDFWECVVQNQTIQATTAMLCQNPHTPQIYQQPPTYQGQGFIPSDLYEAQAWLKKTQKWENHWKKITEL